jgi:hypothetical protein
MIGGHFDSWHMASGTTDNGVSCVLMQAPGWNNPAKPKEPSGLVSGVRPDFIGSRPMRVVLRTQIKTKC